MQISRQYQSLRRLCIFLASRFDAVPDLPGATGASLPELLPPVLDLVAGHGRLVRWCLLDTLARELVRYDGLYVSILQVVDPLLDVGLTLLASGYSAIALVGVDAVASVGRVVVAVELAAAHRLNFFTALDASHLKL